MTSANIIVVLTLILILPSSIATDEAVECDTARIEFNDKFEAASSQFNRDVAHALRKAIDICPLRVALSPMKAAAIEPAVDPLKLKLALIATHGIPAAACRGLHSGHSPDSPQTIWIQAGIYATPEHDSGVADVTYEGSLNAATFAVRGVKWGMDAASTAGASSGVGTLYLHGVGIPATHATANTGCTKNNPDLCWGTGYAIARVPPGLNIASISDTSAFYDC